MYHQLIYLTVQAPKIVGNKGDKEMIMKLQYEVLSHCCAIYKAKNAILSK
jgi:hypothetical protein